MKPRVVTAFSVALLLATWPAAGGDRGAAHHTAAPGSGVPGSAPKFEPWPKTRPSERDLEHGWRQLDEMLADRPPMARYARHAGALYQWAARKFAGEDLGERIYWEDVQPSPVADAEHCVPSATEPGRIHVRLNYGYRGGTDKGKPRPFEEMWRNAVFELYNVCNADDFHRIEAERAEGRLPTSEYVRRMLLTELKAQEKTESFYIHIFLPWAGEHRVPTNSGVWLMPEWLKTNPEIVLLLSSGYVRYTIEGMASACGPTDSLGKAERAAAHLRWAAAHQRNRRSADAAGRPIRPLDLLLIRCVGAMRDYPIDSMFIVEPGGQVSLGAPYGRVDAAGKTLEQTEAAVQKCLCKVAPNALAEVAAFGHAARWRPAEPRAPYQIGPRDRLKISVAGAPAGGRIDGEYVVDSDGEVTLGWLEGSVCLGGLTPRDAESAVAAKLAALIGRVEVAVTLSGWQTDRYMPADRGVIPIPCLKARVAAAGSNGAARRPSARMPRERFFWLPAYVSLGDPRTRLALRTSEEQDQALRGLADARERNERSSLENALELLDRGETLDELSERHSGEVDQWRKDCRKRVEQILSPGQVNLLKSLALDDMVDRAVLDHPEILKRIRVSAEQRKQLHAIRMDVADCAQDEARKAAHRLLGILGPQQAAQFRARAEPFCGRSTGQIENLLEHDNAATDAAQLCSVRRYAEADESLEGTTALLIALPVHNALAQASVRRRLDLNALQAGKIQGIARAFREEATELRLAMRLVAADEMEQRRAEFREKCGRLVARVRQQIEVALTPRQLDVLKDLELVAFAGSQTEKGFRETAGLGREREDALRRLFADRDARIDRVDGCVGQRILAVLKPQQLKLLRDELDHRDWGW